MRVEPSLALPSRPAILGSALILSSFVLVFAGSLLAMTKIDEVYQATERTLHHAVRSVLLSYWQDKRENTELGDLFIALARLERISVGVDLKSASASLAALRDEFVFGPVVDDEIVDRFITSFNELQRGIEEKRQSIARSFHALIAALALSLIVSILVATSLSLRLNASRVAAEWSRISLKRSMAAEEQLRKRIANDLHDDAAQEIAAARMLCERVVAGGHAGSEPAVSALVEEAAGLLSTAGRRIRSLALDLRPPELERSGLVSALEALCARSRDTSGRRASFSPIGATSNLGDDTAIQVYRIVQEALTNARKHAGRHLVEVTMNRTCRNGMDGLMITVRDFPETSSTNMDTLPSGPKRNDSSMSSGLGLTIMHERAALAGGTLAVGFEGSGFQVRLFLPVTGVEGVRS